LKNDYKWIPIYDPYLNQLKWDSVLFKLTVIFIGAINLSTT